MAAAIPEAFGAQAALFAGSYVVLQVGRNVPACALLPRGHQLRARFERILVVERRIRACCGSPAASPRTTRACCCGSPALALDYVAPLAGYWTPGLGRSPTTD